MKITEMNVELIDHMGSDLSVVNAARVSFAAASEWEISAGHRNDDPGVLKERDVKLINYLAKHKHFSPFNHAFLTVRVKAPLFVARQLVKHKFLPWNEISRRYVDFEPEFYAPKGWRKRAENVKQGSSDVYVSEYVYHEFDKDVPLEFQSGVDLKAEEVFTDYIANSLNTYNAFLYAGVCPEQARMVLPQNMMTEWYWSGSLGAFCDMIRLRLDSHTQSETREVAEKIYEKILPLFPVSIKALLEVK